MADTQDAKATATAPTAVSASADQTPTAKETKTEEKNSTATGSEAANGGAAAPAPGSTETNGEKTEVKEFDNAELDKNTGWLPLESNPAVVNPFAHRMGLPSEWDFCDVFALEDWALQMVPRPVAAVVLLFASSEAARKYKLQQHAAIVASGQEVDPSLFYTTQVDGIGNACGTIACMHCLLNNDQNFELKESPLTEFASSVRKLTPLERGQALLRATGLRQISDATASTEAASTACPEADVKTNAHFIAFVERGGTLYELDGRKAFPINHGSSSSATVLEDAAKVIKRDFMDVNPGEIRFNMMALVRTSASPE